MCFGRSGSCCGVKKRVKSVSQRVKDEGFAAKRILTGG